MKLFLLSPDLSRRIDPPVHDLLRSSDSLVDRVDMADVIVVPVTRLDNFRFNPELLSIHKPWVLVDFSEYFWDWDQATTYIFGRNAMDFPWFQQNGEWEKLDRFVRDNPPKMIWQRELLKKDVSPTVQPMEYLCRFGPEKPQTKDEFYGRPIEVLHTWGRSHEMRPLMHGKIFEFSSHCGYDAVGNFDHLEHYEKRHMRCWGAIHTPDFARVDMSKLMHWQRRSKVSLSLAGCGLKCFRHAESPVNSIMAIQESDLAWTYDWDDEMNCVELDLGIGSICTEDNGERGRFAIKKLYDFLKRGDLHEIYERGLVTVDKYRPGRYWSQHVIPTIASKL